MAADINLPLTITRRVTELDGCTSIYFARPRNFFYAAGQWMDLRYPDQPPEAAKTYSFASSPTEPELMISFRDGVSIFKRRLQVAAAGDKLILTQYGGGFRLNPRRPALLLAGGIGLAVFRSMIKEAIDTRVTTSLTLVCVSGTLPTIYHSDLTEWTTAFPALSIRAHATKAQGRLDESTLRALAPDFAARDIYIAGPPAMVHHSVLLAQDIGADPRSIQTDVFDGY